MRRKMYFDYIEDKLNYLAYRVESRGKLNLLELNIHSENFFAELCNIVFNLQFQNANAIQQNIEGIDLIDTVNQTVAQVSSTCSKQKIEKSLSKSVYKNYTSYSYKFIAISKKASSSLKTKVFSNPYNLAFNPSEDIWDVERLLRKIQTMEQASLKYLYKFVKQELGQELNYSGIETNLAGIINVLAEEVLDIGAIPPEINDFAIEDKIEFNELKSVKPIIDDYKIFYHKLDEIYTEFDKLGKNKSFSVLQKVKKLYIDLKKSEKTTVEIFNEIIDSVINIILNSSNYLTLPIDELEMCVDILIVDTFVRCKIFENPEGYNYVITR